MRKWKFNLEPVRQHRHMLEERAALQVSAALRKLSDAVDAARQVRAELLLSAVTFFPREHATPEMLLQLSDYHRVLQVKLAEAVTREKVAANNLNHAREAWNRTRREKEVIDKLFEKSRTEYQFSLLAEEQKLLDSFSRPKAEAVQL